MMVLDWLESSILACSLASKIRDKAIDLFLNQFLLVLKSIKDVVTNGFIKIIST